VRAARRPKASAQPEYISSTKPGARPKPLQREISWCAIMQAKPLWLFFLDQGIADNIYDLLGLIVLEQEVGVAEFADS